jgi:RNA polymerase sigma-70 factor (ECF subfamily)
MDAAPPGGHQDPLEASFEEVFRTGYWSLVRALAIAVDREVAADCVSDAFERAYARWGRVSRYEQPLAWVRRVAVNRLRDHLRRSDRGQRATERVRLDIANAPSEPAEFDIATMLALLPQQQRIAAALFYVDELSVAEVADAMEISEGAVKYHLNRARAALRPLLEPMVRDEA